MLTIAENETPATLDPNGALDSTVDELVILAYDTLLQYKPGDNETTPALATKVESSKSGLEYRFTLRDDVTFHDGSPFTATDVKFTLDRNKELATGVASEMAPYDSSTVISDTELSVKLSQPYAPFLAALSRVYIVNSQLVTQNDAGDNGQAWLSTHDAGSGPYVVSEYQPGEQVTFDAYPGYWGGWEGNHVKTVVMRYIIKSGTQKELLDNGEIDIAMDISKDDLPSYDGNSAFKIDVADTPIQLYMQFDTQGSGPIGDPKFREALQYAFDYQGHVDGVLQGYGATPIGLMPPAMPCQANLPQPTFDLAHAKELLQQAGYGNGGISLTIGYLPDTDEEVGAVQLLQSALSDLGIELVANGFTFPAHVDSMKSIDTTSDINLIYTFPPYADPNAVIYQAVYSGNTLGRGYNFAQYDNPTVDQLVLQAQAETDPATRCDLYDQIQKIVADDHIGINASLPQYVTTMSSQVVGYHYNPWHHQTVNAYDIGLSGSGSG